MLGSSGFEIDVERNSVLDGNHRVAVHLVAGVPITLRWRAPYQTVQFPVGVVPGRRSGGRVLPVLVRGKTVLDIGCCDGMMSVAALHAGATSVVSVDRDLRSTTWQLRNAWGYANRMDIRVLNADDLEVQDVDMVFAFSVIQHIGLRNFVRLTEGRECVLETHHEGAELPDSGHEWERLGHTQYSVAEPDRRRDLYLWVPK